MDLCIWNHFWWHISRHQRLSYIVQFISEEIKRQSVFKERFRTIIRSIHFSWQLEKVESKLLTHDCLSTKGWTFKYICFKMTGVQYVSKVKNHRDLYITNILQKISFLYFLTLQIDHRMIWKIRLKLLTDSSTQHLAALNFIK